MTTHLPHLDVGSGRRQGALTLFPVWSGTSTLHGLRWSTTGLAVEELSNGAEVGRLHVGNPSSKPVVLLEGDLLVGGMQNRMAALGALVPARASMAVDVLCVEQGRWAGARDHRASDRRGTYAVRQGSVGGRERGTAQHDVWARVSRYDRTLGPSPTSSMLDHLDGTEGESMQLLPGQRGVIVGIGGRVIGLELFGSSRGLRARWEGLVRAARLDARTAPAVRTSSHDARSFVRALGRVELRDGDPAGLARSLRADAGRLAISGLATAEPLAPLLHLAAFDSEHPLLVAA